MKKIPDTEKEMLLKPEQVTSRVVNMLDKNFPDACIVKEDHTL